MATILGSCILPAIADNVARPTANSKGDITVLRYLSPSLSASERIYMYRALAQIPERYRRAVLVFEQDGTLHANDPTLLNSATSWYIKPGTRIAFNRSGQTMVLPNDSGGNACGAMGFCHRRVSFPGFTYVSASVTVPCNSVFTISGDTGYAYVGAPAVGTLPEVDAGVQFYTKTIDQQPLSMQIYLLAGSAAITYNPGGKHFICSPPPTITEQFQPLAPQPDGSQMLMLVDSGPIFGGGNMVTAMAAFRTTVVQLNCSACTVKRVTALATKQTSAPDNSYVGVFNAYGNPSPGVAWTGSLHGVATAQFGFAQNVGAFYELYNNQNNLGSPPIGLCATPGPQASPPANGSQNETIGVNYVPNAQNGPTCQH